MIIATHNTDNGAGCERDGEGDCLFGNFSEKISSPPGRNFIFHAMTP